MARRRQTDEKRDKMIPGIKATARELDNLDARAKSIGMNRSVHKVKRLRSVDDRTLAELARQGADLRDLWNDHGHENGCPSEASAGVLRKMGETVERASQLGE